VVKPSSDFIADDGTGAGGGLSQEHQPAAFCCFVAPTVLSK
jgi:hypothetical protein